MRSNKLVRIETAISQASIPLAMDLVGKYAKLHYVPVDQGGGAGNIVTYMLRLGLDGEVLYRQVAERNVIDAPNTLLLEYPLPLEINGIQLHHNITVATGNSRAKHVVSTTPDELTGGFEIKAKIYTTNGNKNLLTDLGAGARVVGVYAFQSSGVCLGEFRLGPVAGASGFDGIFRFNLSTTNVNASFEPPYPMDVSVYDQTPAQHALHLGLTTMTNASVTVLYAAGQAHD